MPSGRRPRASRPTRRGLAMVRPSRQPVPPASRSSRRSCRCLPSVAWRRCVSAQEPCLENPRPRRPRAGCWRRRLRCVMLARRDRRRPTPTRPPRGVFAMMRQTAWILGGAILAMTGGMAAAETPKDTVVMAKQIDDIISLDPGEVFEFSGGEITGNVYDALLDFNVNKVSEVRGRLAESWGVADDGRTYTFKLKQGLKFASGNS